MQKYAEKIQPNVSDVWRGDEIYMKIRGKQKYLFALMDDETRYLNRSRGRSHKEQSMMRKSLIQKCQKKSRAKTPIRLITDGLGSYANAYECRVQESR